VLYEMLTGRRTFEGEGVSKRWPPCSRAIGLDALPREIPTPIRALLEGR
jgi:hypothetical protein